MYWLPKQVIDCIMGGFSHLQETMLNGKFGSKEKECVWCCKRSICFETECTRWPVSVSQD